MKNRNVLNSPRLLELKRRRTRAFFSRTFFYFLGLAVVLALAVYLSRLPGINIETVEVEGASIVEGENIKAVAQEKISGKYLWLIPKTNVLFYPKEKIVEALTSQYKRLGEINLSIKNNRVLVVAVTEHQPLYTWCGVDLSVILEDTEKPHKCYFLDKDGYVFDEAPYFSGDVYFKFYGLQGVNPENPTGSYFAQEYFQNLISFKQGLETLALEPITFYLKEDGDAELYLSGTKNPKPKIFIRTDSDMENLTGNLEAALRTEPLKTRMEKEYAKLEYLDLRFDNKVYSKFITP